MTTDNIKNNRIKVKLYNYSHNQYNFTLHLITFHNIKVKVPLIINPDHTHTQIPIQKNPSSTRTKSKQTLNKQIDEPPLTLQPQKLPLLHNR